MSRGTAGELSAEQLTFRKFVAGIPNFERLSFPTLYPNGHGGFDDPSCEHSSFYDYANDMIESHDHFRVHKGWRAFIAEMSAQFHSIGICGQIGVSQTSSKRRRKKRKKKKKNNANNKTAAPVNSSTPNPTNVTPPVSASSNEDAVLAMAQAGKTVQKVKQTKGIDYSKWDNLVVSSSEDEEESRSRNGSGDGLRWATGSPQDPRHHPGE